MHNSVPCNSVTLHTKYLCIPNQSLAEKVSTVLSNILVRYFPSILLFLLISEISVLTTSLSKGKDRNILSVSIFRR